MKTFKAELITPVKTFFEGEIVRLNVTASDGYMEILADHMPSLCEITSGKCEITLPDNTKRVFASDDGILNIQKNGIVVTSDLLEWEEDLENALKEKELHIEAEHKRRSESYREYKLGTVALERAFANLKINKTRNY